MTTNPDPVHVALKDAAGSLNAAARDHKELGPEMAKISVNAALDYLQRAYPQMYVLARAREQLIPRATR